MSNITAPWWSELPRGWKEVFCNTEETKLKFSCVTLKNKISACKVALWIACDQALHLGESRFTRHKWRACEQAPLGRTIDNSAGLVSLVSRRWRSPFWGLFALIRSHHTPHALLACLQLLPSSLVPLTLNVEEADATCITTRASPHYHAPPVSGVLEFHNGVKLWGMRANRLKDERTSPNYGTAPGSFYSVVLLAVEVAIWNLRLKVQCISGSIFFKCQETNAPFTPTKHV